MDVAVEYSNVYESLSKALGGEQNVPPPPPSTRRMRVRSQALSADHEAVRSAPLAEDDALAYDYTWRHPNASELCSGVGYRANQTALLFVCEDVEVSEEEWVVREDAGDDCWTNSTLVEYCECPRDRTGVTCDRRRGITCDVARLHPLTVCPPPVTRNNDHLLDGERVCHQYALSATVGFEWQLDCRFATFASSDTVWRNGTDARGFVYNVVRFTEDAAASNNTNAELQTLLLLSPDTNLTRLRLQSKIYNMNRLSDDLFTHLLPIPLSALLAQSTITQDLQLSAVPNALYAGGRLYMEARVLALAPEAVAVDETVPVLLYSTLEEAYRRGIVDKLHMDVVEKRVYENDDGGLKGWEVALIVIGCLFAVGLAVGALWVWVMRQMAETKRVQKLIDEAKAAASLLRIADADEERVMRSTALQGLFRHRAATGATQPMPEGKKRR